MKSEITNSIIKTAKSLLGTPYKYAVAPEDIPKFLDCSSFTQFVFKQQGIDIPRSTILQATAGQEIIGPKDLEPGDLLFYRGSKGHYNDELFPSRPIYIGHVALYLGNDLAIHAASKTGVAEEALDVISKERGPIVMIKRI